VIVLPVAAPPAISPGSVVAPVAAPPVAAANIVTTPLASNALATHATEPQSDHSALAEAIAQGAMPVPAVPETGRFAFDDLSSFWADPRPLWEEGKQDSSEELPVPRYEIIEDAPQSSPAFVSEAEPSWYESGAEQEELEPAAFLVSRDDLPESVAMPDVTGATGVDVAPQADGATPADGAALDITTCGPGHLQTGAGTCFWEDEAADPLTRLSVKVETAEQLLALPPQERIDMTAFLEPTELAATFRATTDLALKRAVIDTLEHIGSPASLNALGNCFEDGDSEIQLYALQAADRLLGVA
jgi:hypothetical protein